MANDEKRRGFRAWWLVILVTGAIGVGWWVLRNDRPEAPQFVTSAVTRGDITQVVTANGTLNPVLNVQVGSQISGIIQRLYADFNTQVKSNQVVAQLDPATFQAAVHQAEGDLANAKAALELQEIETRRSAKLFSDQLISESDSQKSVADLHQAQALVQIKQASLERAQVDLSRCTIYAPVDGIVISRSVDVGQTVAASMNAPTLFVIANDLSKMQIDANVSEADVGTVEEKQAASFTVDAFPSRTFNGQVTQIRNSPITVQNVVTYDTVIAVNNPDLKLKPGMTATVSITTAQKSGVVKVPNAALRFRPPEPPTNHSWLAGLMAKIGLGPAAKTNVATISTNAVSSAAAGTNVPAATEAALPPLTGTEPPEELMRRVREMRERGEEIPPEVRSRMRQMFENSGRQRGGGGDGPGGGGGGGRGGPGGGGAAAMMNRPRPSNAPAWRTVYVLSTNTPAGGGEAVLAPTPVRIRTGISDGSSTEIIEGLKEGDTVISSVKLPQAQVVTAPQGQSPFGGGGGRRF